MTTAHHTTEDYAFAQAEFYTHRRTLAGYAALLSETGRLLRDHTDRVTVAGLGLSSQRPGSPAIDGQALPDPADIQRLLVLYRGAYARLRATWDGLTPAERDGLRPPPSDLPTLRPATE
ncbi:hypothetical protein ACRBEV_22885 [Methylobacterium phyllosphaerae]